MGVVIKGFGHFIPSQTVTNAELSKRLGITEEYILEKTGIEERTIYKEGGTSELIIKAATMCMQQTGTTAAAIDLILVTTGTPDYYCCPSTASVVHRKLQTINAAG